MPLVSVIVPFYKIQEKDFLRSLNSLHSQKLMDAEFLLVSDGAPRQAVELADSFVKRDSRFRLFLKENGGVSSARNFGLRKATGTFVTFVDADDAVSPDMCGAVSEFALKNDNDIVVLDVACFEPDRVELRLAEKSIPVIPEALRQEFLKRCIWHGERRFTGVISACCKAFRRQMLLDNFIAFPETIPVGEDRVFNFLAYAKAERIGYLSDTLYFYYAVENSAMHSYREDALWVYLRYVQWFASSPALYSRYAPAIGGEAFNCLYSSWDFFYMHPRNPRNYFRRMLRLSDDIKSLEFQKLVRFADISELSLLKRVECFMFKHKITLFAWVHGLKQMISRKKLMG